MCTQHLCTCIYNAHIYTCTCIFRCTVYAEHKEDSTLLTCTSAILFVYNLYTQQCTYTYIAHCTCTKKVACTRNNTPNSYMFIPFQRYMYMCTQNLQTSMMYNRALTEKDVEDKGDATGK